MLIKRIMPAGIFMVTSTAFANTAIETETAQIGKQGELGISQSIEYAKAKDGNAGSTLTQIEYGISDRSELLIEPFLYQWEAPKGEKKEEGTGDLEITPSYMVVIEDGWVPAILVATKVKVPLGSKNVGGTGEYDYMPYLIFGQHAGGWTFNANIGENFAAKEESNGYGHTLVWDLEAEREIAPKLTGFYEVFSAEDGIKSVSTALQYQVAKNANIFLAVSYNEDDEAVIRPGFNLDF